jgi:uncharacterized membrane protein YjdF
MTPESPRLLPVFLFTGTYMAAAVIGAMRQANREFVFYIAVMLVLIAVMAAVHRAVRLSAPLLWAFSIWGLLHMAGGLLTLPEGLPYEGPHAVLYSFWLIPERLKYDQIVHAYGFGITTWLCWHALSSSLRRRYGVNPAPTAGLLTLCAAAGMGFGALNEVIEFAAVLSLPDTNVGGYENTGWDLVANLVGAVVAALLLRFRASARD